MTRFSLCILCAVLFLTVFLYVGPEAFSSRHPGTPQRHVTLRMFGFKDGKTQVEAMESILHAFKKEYPEITVTYESLANRDGYLKILHRRFAARRADDLFMLNPYAFPHVAAAGHLGDTIMDLSDMPFVAALDDRVRELMITEKGIPGVPLEMAITGLYVNVDMLREHRLALPRNLGEFLNACQVLHQEAGIVPLEASAHPDGASLGQLIYAASLYAFYTKAALPGETLYDRAPRDLAELFRPGLRLVSLLTREGYWDSRAVLRTRGWEEELRGFVSGEYAFFIGGGWCNRLILNAAPRFGYAFVPLPLAPDENFIMAGPASPVCINKRSPRRREAELFLTFLMRPENVNAFAASQDALSPLKGYRNPGPFLRYMTAPLQEGRIMPNADPRFRIPLQEVLGKAGVALLKGADIEEGLRIIERGSTPKNRD